MIISDNKLAANAGWDEALLKLEIGELQELDFDIELLGFDEDALTELLGEAYGEVVEDQVPASGLTIPRAESY